jgi:microcompartment protein CcmL/EutN
MSLWSAPMAMRMTPLIKLVSVLVIPRPHEEAEKILPGSGPVKRALG